MENAIDITPTPTVNNDRQFVLIVYQASDATKSSLQAFFRQLKAQSRLVNGEVAFVDEKEAIENSDLSLKLKEAMNEPGVYYQDFSSPWASITSLQFPADSEQMRTFFESFEAKYSSRNQTAAVSPQSMSMGGKSLLPLLLIAGVGFFIFKS
jgi:hypothetical protein